MSEPENNDWTNGPVNWDTFGGPNLADAILAAKEKWEADPDHG